MPCSLLPSYERCRHGSGVTYSSWVVYVVCDSKEQKSAKRSFPGPYPVVYYPLMSADDMAQVSPKVRDSYTQFVTRVHISRLVYIFVTGIRSSWLIYVARNRCGEGASEARLCLHAHTPTHTPTLHIFTHTHTHTHTHTQDSSRAPGRQIVCIVRDLYT